MAKKAKRHENVEKRDDCSEDLISELPDDILVCILSQLTTKEAVRACVLSHRWEKLWTFTTGSLSFDGSKWMLRAMKFCESRRIPKKCEIDMERANFVGCVNHVLEVHQGPSVEEFSVSCDLDRLSTSDIDSWVYFAIEKRVQRLNLELSTRVDVPRKKNYYFPNLHLLRTRVTDFSSYNSLTALSLDRVNVNGLLLEYFLSSSPFLEKLSVSCSYSLVNLRVAGPSLKLKHLEISNCCRMENIEIFAADLVYFKYNGRVISMAFKNVPKLADVYVGHGYCKNLMNHILDHSSYLSQLETLTLDASSYVEYVRFPVLPELVNLKQLVLTVSAAYDDSLLPYSPLLEAAPFLRRFVLQLIAYDHGIQREVRRKSTQYPYLELKVVELIGFVGGTIDVEFALHLLETAISLDKMIIDSRSPFLRNERVEMVAAREQAKQLKKKLPLGAELVIL